MSEAASIPIDRWAAELQPTIDASAGLFKRIIVLKETDSTQDAARRMDARIDDVILAGRQTAGRGRLGRAWQDTGDHGVAMTVVLKADRPERMAVVTAVATAFAIMTALKVCPGSRHPAIGIKWPNDIMAGARKVAGILVEVVGDRALVGIGINVSQPSWPPELAGRAVSLRQLGFLIERVMLIDLVLQGLLGWSSDRDELLAARFQEFDVMQGGVATFRSGGVELRGTVLRIDPMRGLAVRTDQGEVWLPAATTSVLEWHGPVQGD